MRFSPDVRKCYFEDEKKLRFYKTYSKALCDYECLANETFRVCGCVKFSMPRDYEMKVCNISSLKCIERGVYKLSCDCYPPCNDVKYSYTVEKIAFDREMYIVDELLNR
jgi:amiloride-sensitive sodium channel